MTCLALVRKYRLTGLAAVAVGSFAACSDGPLLESPSSETASRSELAAAAAVTGAPLSANSGPAALYCPPTVLGNTNLAINPSFELGKGPQTFPPGSSTKPSAATGWNMHTSNSLAPITTARVALPFFGVPNPPGPAPAVGKPMLRIASGSNEGGVFQQITTPASVMFSIWVYVRKGRAFLILNPSSASPSAWTTKHNEWEQIRVCTDGSFPGGYFAILNEDINGGEFFVDRAEIREIIRIF